MTQQQGKPVVDENDTEPIGVRLPNWLWADLEKEATRVGITRNELITRLLIKAVQFDHVAPALPGFSS